MKKILLTIFTAILLITNTVYAAVPPKPTRDIYVVDTQNLLSKSTRQYILDNSSYIDSKTKAQIVVVTVDTTGEDSIEDYSNKLFNKWGIGDKKLDNGLLILVAKNDRKYRIEVGYGLEGALPDAYVSDIKDEMKSYFSEGDFDGGIRYAYDNILPKVYSEYNLTAPENINGDNYASSESKHSEKAPSPIAVVGGIIFILLFIFSPTFRKIVFFFAIFGGNGKHSGRDHDDWGGFGGGGGSSGGGFGGGESGGGGSSGGW